ncbi:MAG TPA: ABC transporter permease, partial [Salinisphaeraceae bacterium]|nr:ABC transporter permease [Salinisphaeraceae bacterium]
LGATRAQVITQVLADAMLIGMIGTALGLLCGMALALVLVDLVLQTVQELYFQSAVGSLRITASALAPAVLLGLGGTLAAALAPAREAAAVAPRAALARSDLEVRTRRGVRQAALLGCLVLLVGACLPVASNRLSVGFAGLFAIILGFALTMPWATALLGCWLARRVSGRLGLRLAVNGAVASLSRTGVAVAALAVAVAAVIGIGVMIDSFRASVADWLQQSLAADFYVDASQLLPDELAQRLAALPGVDHVARRRFYRQATAAGYTQLWGLGLPPGITPAVELVAGVPQLWQQWHDERAVLLSEPFAWARGLAVGDSLELRAQTGRQVFEVVGIFRDYGATSGVVLMRLQLFRELWGDARLSSLGVYATPGTRRAALQQRLAAELAGKAGVRIRDNQALYRHSLAIFDRTFLITSVLRLLAALVAFVGVLGALMALQLDRAREYATLRALGLRRRALAGLIVAQSGLLGLAASLFAIPLGLILAWLLVYVINRRAFGWSMDFAIRAEPLATGVALALAAALAAALYPAWRAAQATSAQALREE